MINFKDSKLIDELDDIIARSKEKARELIKNSPNPDTKKVLKIRIEMDYTNEKGERIDWKEDLLKEKRSSSKSKVETARNANSNLPAVK